MDVLECLGLRKEECTVKHIVGELLRYFYVVCKSEYPLFIAICPLISYLQLFHFFCSTLSHNSAASDIAEVARKVYEKVEVEE